MLTRREFLQKSSTGFGSVALAGLLDEERRSAAHFRPRAKSVIFLFMSGGVSHVDTFDPKPRLARDHGKEMPVPLERTQFDNNGKIFRSPWPFSRHGESGIPVSALFPHVATCVDELAVVRSITSKFNEHAQANFFLHSGFPFLGHPSAGAWTVYGLGREARNLPGYVVLQSGRAGVPHGGVGLFSNGFLPATTQGSIVRADGREPVRNVRSREPRRVQRQRLDFLRHMDGRFAAKLADAEPVESAIRNYELAYEMQAAVPELIDLRGEPDRLKRAYGIEDRDANKAAYGRQCLLARRLVERGVRFVELSCLSYGIGGGNGANPWDQHSDLMRGHERMARQVDQPIAALLKDLKARGLLEETLVVWAGEFGRTPFSQGGTGRDHNPFGFSVWLAGGGIRGGTVYGATDELGYHAVENRCEVYDLWATVLHLLGVDHRDLTHRFGGRDLRLTDVHGDVLRGILA